jgi:hypothetical protein
MDKTHIYLGVFALVFMCITGVSLILYFSLYDIQQDLPKPVPLKPVKPPSDQFPGQPQSLNMRYSKTKLY